MEWGKAVGEEFNESSMEALLNARESLIPVLREKIVVLEKAFNRFEEVRPYDILWCKMRFLSLTVTLFSSSRSLLTIY